MFKFKEKLVSLHIAMALLGGVGQLEVAAMPTIEDSEVVDTQRVRSVEDSENETSMDNVIVDGKNNQQIELSELMKSVENKNLKLKEEIEKTLEEENHSFATLEVSSVNEQGYDFYMMDKNFKELHIDNDTMEYWGLDDMQTNDVVTAVMDEEGNELLGFLKQTLVASSEREDVKLIEIELVEKYENEVYFYDNNSEYEPRIYVDMAMMEKFNVEDMVVGEKITGIFDSEGWELYGLKKESEK